MKWEYLNERIECTYASLEKILYEYGQKGWEVASIEKLHPANRVFYVLFKRSKRMNPSER